MFPLYRNQSVETGFYIMGTLGVKGLKAKQHELSVSHHKRFYEIFHTIACLLRKCLAVAYSIVTILT